MASIPLFGPMAEAVDDEVTGSQTMARSLCGAWSLGDLGKVESLCPSAMPVFVRLMGGGGGCEEKVVDRGVGVALVVCAGL